MKGKFKVLALLLGCVFVLVGGMDIFAETVCDTDPEAVEYEPTVDVDSGIPIQGELRENMVTIVEAWESVDALHAHLKAPHMLTYREQVKDLVKDIRIQVLEPA